jgi:coproporphyrinogen III oxidase-like Fe-S oxidoreductase
MKHQINYNIESLLATNQELNLNVNEYNINVTANYGKLLGPSELFNFYKAFEGSFQPTHLYFHIPICTYVCHFCNYVKKKIGGQEELDKWVDLLTKESSFYLQQVQWLKRADIQSIYFGGGTASILGIDRLAIILDHVRKNYRVNKNCECTLEGNPDNFLGNEIKEAVSIGFNRFSLGVQSFQTEVNKYAGRGHDREMSLNAIYKLNQSKKPFNVDMMFGLPFQNKRSVKLDIETLTEFKVPTITIYRLRNVNREAMGIGNMAAWNVPKIKERMVSNNIFPSLNDTYSMRDAAVETLLNCGYAPSPCGWWNAPNTYPNGNIPQVSKNKWENFNSMVAFGPGAYGWLTGNSRNVIQTHNEKDINLYVKKMESITDSPPLSHGRFLSDVQAVATALGFAYKANQKISLYRFKKIYDVDLLNDIPYSEIIDEMLQKGFLEISSDKKSLKPTLLGEALHEEIISVYIHRKIGEFSYQTCNKV